MLSKEGLSDCNCEKGIRPCALKETTLRYVVGPGLSRLGLTIIIRTAFKVCIQSVQLTKTLLRL